MATQYNGGQTSGSILTAATMNSIGAAWETWTPAVTQSGAVTATVTLGRYMRIQKLVIAVAKLAITGTGTTNNAVKVSLPITAKDSGQIVGSGFIYDASTNLTYLVTAESDSTTTTSFYADGNAGASFWGQTPNVAITNLDQINITLMYEAA